MKKRFFSTFLAFLLSANTIAFASENIQRPFVISGHTNIVKTDPNVNINPWNRAVITGVGENNTFRIVSTYDVIDIPLGAPLYRVSDAYYDKICKKNDVWGVERSVAVTTFDGSEDWQLLPNPGYRNNNTTIFYCSNPIQTPVRDGICTHFDVVSDEKQKNYIYDAISFGRQTDQIFMRFMNVRNVTTVEALKTYLKAQKDAGIPVKFYFARSEPTFEPFEDAIQERLAKVDWSTVGFVD